MPAARAADRDPPVECLNAAVGAEETLVHSARRGRGELGFMVDLGGISREIHYLIDPPITPSPEATIPAVLLPAMTVGRPLRFELGLDPVTRRNLAELQGIFSAWADAWPYPVSPPVEIELRAGQAEPAPPPDDRGIGAFFSGGVDSFATVLDHPEITHLVFIVGVDLAPDQTALHEFAVERLRAAAGELGRELIVVETDLRRQTEDVVPWEGFHGSVLASVARLLSPVLSRVYIASETPYRAQHRRGSHPMIDHLWGNADLELVHDGARFSRVEKVQRIADDPVAAATLRVCWENRGAAYNCCECEKCLRTMVTLRILGKLDRFATFPLDLHHEAVAALVPSRAIERDYWRENLDLALAHHAETEVIGAIEACLANGEALVAPPAKVRIDQLEGLVRERTALLTGVTESASWRLTAPLRRAKSVLLGAARSDRGPR